MDLHETAALTTRDGCKLTVRRLTANDAKALQQFDADLSAESHRKFLPHGYDDESVAKVLARSESGDDFTLGAFDGDRIVGYFFLWYMDKAVPLLGIGMLDAYQHRGLGRQMMQLLMQHGRDTGRDGIELTTMLDNDNAFALYQKVGFVYQGNVENVAGDGKVQVERHLFYAIKPGAQAPTGAHGPPHLGGVQGRGEVRRMGN